MKHIGHGPQERLARALQRAFLAAFVELRPNALAPPTPEWDAVKDVPAQGWRAVARHLLKCGVKPPEE